MAPYNTRSTQKGSSTTAKTANTGKPSRRGTQGGGKYAGRHRSQTAGRGNKRQNDELPDVDGKATTKKTRIDSPEVDLPEAAPPYTPENPVKANALSGEDSHGTTDSAEEKTKYENQASTAHRAEEDFATGDGSHHSDGISEAPSDTSELEFQQQNADRMEDDIADPSPGLYSNNIATPVQEKKGLKLKLNVGRSGTVTTHPITPTSAAHLTVHPVEEPGVTHSTSTAPRGRSTPCPVVGNARVHKLEARNEKLVAKNNKLDWENRYLLRYAARQVQLNAQLQAQNKHLNDFIDDQEKRVKAHQAMAVTGHSDCMKAEKACDLNYRFAKGEYLELLRVQKENEMLKAQLADAEKAAEEKYSLEYEAKLAVEKERLLDVAQDEVD